MEDIYLVNKYFTSTYKLGILTYSGLDYLLKSEETKMLLEASVFTASLPPSLQMC